MIPQCNHRVVSCNTNLPRCTILYCNCKQCLDKLCFSQMEGMSEHIWALMVHRIDISSWCDVTRLCVSIRPCHNITFDSVQEKREKADLQEIDSGQRSICVFTLSRWQGRNFGSCYYAAIWPMYLWCNWSPATGCNMEEWYCCTSPYNTLQFRIDSLCIIVPDPWLDLPKPLSRWADLLFRGFAPNVPQNLPQQSQCAVRWVVVLPRDIQTYPNRISIECHSIGKPTCCRRFVASRWWSLWGQYLQF